MPLNDEQQKAYNLIKEGKNVFLTGEAGTGKSYVISEVKKNIPDRFVHTATTGIAALNIGGQTIHSLLHFCGEAENFNVRELVIKALKRHNALENVKGIIIDEISMMDADTFNFVEYVLRKVKAEEGEEGRPFGGIQMIVVGDLYQLPPVDIDYDRDNQINHYDHSHFIFSGAYYKGNFELVNLTKQERQASENDNEKFLDLLRDCRRGNELSDEQLNLLASCEKEPSNDILRLFATNAKADELNKKRNDELPTPSVSFYANDSLASSHVGAPDWIMREALNVYNKSDFDFQAECKKYLSKLKVADTIELKVGSRVILLKNLYRERYQNYKGLVNGRIGTVKDVHEHFVIVDFDAYGNCAEERNVYIYPENFPVVSHQLKIVERTQIPLALGWAITIHKSQGMTLETAYIDLSNVFAMGQAYVALSRLRSINGLYIKGVNKKSFTKDPTKLRGDINNFYDKNFDENKVIEDDLLYECAVIGNPETISELQKKYQNDESDFAKKILEKISGITKSEELIERFKDFSESKYYRKSPRKNIKTQLEHYLNGREDPLSVAYQALLGDINQATFRMFEKIDEYKNTPNFVEFISNTIRKYAESENWGSAYYLKVINRIDLTFENFVIQHKEAFDSDVFDLAKNRYSNENEKPVTIEYVRNQWSAPLNTKRQYILYYAIRIVCGPEYGESFNRLQKADYIKQMLYSAIQYRRGRLQNWFNFNGNGDPEGYYFNGYKMFGGKQIGNQTIRELYAEL